MGEIMKHPDELYPLMKLMLSAKLVEKKMSVWLLQPHWAFCYATLRKVSRSFALVIQQLPSDLRDVVCVYYLVLRALDIDDTRLTTEVRVPILKDFYCHLHDPEWHFSCKFSLISFQTSHINLSFVVQWPSKFLWTNHHVSIAFLELDTNICKWMGEGMEKFLCKEVETIDDYNEYCHYAAGLCGLGLSKLFYASGREDLAPEPLSISMGLFLQKISIIRDYLEDINEVPKCCMFWPHQIWSKYVNTLEVCFHHNMTFKYEENSVKAVQCLNEMVTNALLHVEDCLVYMSNLRDPSIFQFCAIPLVINMGNLTMYYNNVEIFKGVVEMRRGLCAKIIDQTRTMADVYGAFFDFCCIMESKKSGQINTNTSKLNATSTLKRLEEISKTCRNSGTLINQRKSYTCSHQPNYNIPIIFFFIMLAILLSTKIP
ncbi:hypothetical protein R3W88_028281 [Solanum pinnatisectum]|uniref:Squalene synthase n=1 Tax=Solanum pinnatisectum TaxID=50273 RepID=A0AAV9LM82_9SOLN|nr:hypothetical protein R3W88_028281 [Solanum pinnatisectum]